MLKFLSLFLIIPILMAGQFHSDIDFFSDTKSIDFYMDGQIIEGVSKQQFDKFEDLFSDALEGAKTMPAYSLTTDEDVKAAMQSGMWIEFTFNERKVVGDMPFDSLLIKICKDCKGINVIRGNEGVYGGKCFYLQLEGNFNKVYDFVNSLKKQPESEVELESEEIKETVIVSEEEDDDKSKQRKNGVINIEGEGKSQEKLLKTLDELIE